MMPETPQTTWLITSLIRLRQSHADETNKAYVRCWHPRLTPFAAGLIEFSGDDNLAWLTPDGWELAERMIAAADDQLTLWRREQDGTLTPEDAEKRRVA